MKTDSDLMILEKYLYYNEGVVLDDRLQKKLEVLERVFEWIRELLYKWDVIDKIKFFYKIPPSQAYVMYSEAWQLFKLDQADLLANTLLKDMKEAKRRGKLDVSAKIGIALLKYEQSKEAKASDIYRNLEPHTIILGFFPETTGVELPADWQEQLKLLVEDSPYGTHQVVKLTERASADS